MAPAGPGRLIRPMLELTRNEIRSYLFARDIDFVEDSSNLSTAILRNRVRAELLPMLERDYAPGLSKRLGELAREMRALDDLSSTAAARELGAIRRADGGLDIPRFAKLHPALQTAAMRAYIADRTGGLRGIDRSHVAAIINLIESGGPNAEVSIPGEMSAVRQYDSLRIEKLDREPARGFRVPIRLDGITTVEEAGFEFYASTHRAGKIAMPADLSAAVFDAEKVARLGLVARNFVRGDRVNPFGMRGGRKMKDVFIDLKVNRSRRASFPIVALGDAIAWVPGLVRGRHGLVTGTTSAVLRLQAREMAF